MTATTGKAKDGGAPLLCSARLTITIMMFMACLITYLLRLNVGFAMVCMIRKSPVTVYLPPLEDASVTPPWEELTPVTPVTASGAPPLLWNSPSALVNDSTNVTIGDPVGPREQESNVLTDFIDGVLDSLGLSEDNQSDCYIGSFSPKDGARDDISIGEFDWEKHLQGLLLGAFFYGYIVTQVPAGWLCEKIGGKIVLGTGLGIVSVLTLLIPEAARWNPYSMLAIRVVQGMFGAVSFPAIHAIIGNWAPPTERGLLMSISYSGMYVGTLLTFPLCGLLCKYGFDGGWPSVFYVTGGLGVLFSLAMTVLVYDGYDRHPRISSQERNYLQKTLIGHHEHGAKVHIPWCKFLTSGPVWAITIAHLCCNWGLYTLVINLPLFMKEVLQFDIKQNGLLSSLPYVCTLVVNLFCGKFTDFLRRRNACSITALRKIFNCIGMLIPCLCMLILTLLSCTTRYIAVAVLTCCQAFSGFAYSGGFFYNHVDLSPQHAAILMGISNTFATIPGIVSPLLVGLLTPNGTRQEWAIIFYIGGVAYAFGAFFYLIFASGERQSWSYTAEELLYNGKQKEAILKKDTSINSSTNPGTSV